MCLHDVFKLPRKDATFTRTVVFEKAGLIDFEVKILPYDNDSFSFLLGTSYELSILNYNARRNQAILRNWVDLDTMSLIYVMSVKEVIVKQNGAQDLSCL